MLWGCKGPLTCWTYPLHLPCMGVPPYMFYTPHSLVGFPVHLYVLGISACEIGNISLMLGVWGGVPPSIGGFWGHQQMGCPYASSCMFL